MTKDENNESFINKIKNVLFGDLVKKNIEVHNELKRNITKFNNEIIVKFI